MSSQPPLPSTPQRQAVSTIEGYLYQIWYSLNEWIRLAPNETLYLEGAEDLDRVSNEDANTIQVRQTQSKISLNTKYAQEALAKFWETKERETAGNRRTLRYTYLTTSEVAVEKNAFFGGRSGIETWKHARFEESSAELLRTYLTASGQTSGALLHFLQTASIEQLQKELFSSFHWVTDAPDFAQLKDLVTDSLAERLLPANLGRANIEAIRDRLLARCLDTIRDKNTRARFLTSAKLDLEIQEANTFYVPLPVGSLGGLVSSPHMLSLHGVEMPIPPEPLLNRSRLTGTVATHLRMRQPVFLTGSVFKGKTTIATLVGREAFANDAWWIDLKQRSSEALRDIFAFIAAIVSQPATPNLVILDDLDTGQAAKNVYGRALSNLIYRAKSAGKAVLLTAQGSAESLEKTDAKSWGVVVVDVPSMGEREIQEECLNAGCLSTSEAVLWADAIIGQTAGHPKLVQVRIEELVEMGWPRCDPVSTLRTSAAVQSAIQMAQGLFFETVDAAEADYVYAIAEFTVPPTREMLMNLSDLPPPLQGAASLLHKLEGKWLEVVRGNRYRVTPILRATVGETWSKARHRSIHRNIFDAVAKCSTLSGRDGAALIFHGVVSQDSARIKMAYQALFSMKERVKEEALNQLSWIIPLANGRKEVLYPFDKQSSLWLRHVQFQAGEFQNAPELNDIVRCWRDEILDVQGRARGVAELAHHFSIFLTRAHLSPEIVLNSAVWIQNATSQRSKDAMVLESLAQARPVLGLPESATRFQTFLGAKFDLIRGIDDFVELLNWFMCSCPEELIREVNEMYTWRTVILNGLFVHSGWIADSKLKSANWERWERELHRAWDIAKSKVMPAFGIEVARALSVITSEHMSDLLGSLRVLDDALVDFGPSAVLVEQRSNAYFQAGRYADAVDSWNSLVYQFGRYACLDPNSYRRTALAASHLSMHLEAAQLFEDGANTLSPGEEMPTRCALLAEAALAYHNAGKRVEAANLMAKCVDEIPRGREIESDGYWEAALRMFGAIATTLAGHSAVMNDGKPVVIRPGMASAPLMKISRTDENHRMRMTLLELAVITAKLKAENIELRPSLRLSELLESPDPLTRWLTSLNLLGHLLESSSSEWFPELVEKTFSALEIIRETTQFANAQRDVVDVMGAYYVLAAICDKRPLNELVLIWLHGGATALTPLTHQIFGRLNEGWNSTPIEAVQLITDSEVSVLLRCGAALRLLSGTLRDARVTAYSQGLLIHALQVTGVRTAFKGINIDSLIALRFAMTWEEIIFRPHLFVAPTRTIPALKAELDLARKSRGELQDLLRLAGAAGGLDLASLIDSLA